MRTTKFVIVYKERSNSELFLSFLYSKVLDSLGIGYVITADANTVK